MAAEDSIFSGADLARMIVEVSPAGMLIVDGRGRIVLANPQSLVWFGYSEGELLGQPVEILIAPMYREQHVASRESYLKNPRPRSMAGGRDLFARRKDGSEFPVDISLHPIETSEGSMVLANIVDATPRHEAEKERELRESLEKLSLLGQLAGGVAHEIRTPLCVISNDVYFLETISPNLSEDANECISEIKNSVAKANRIVSELLDFTRDPASELQMVSLEQIITSAIAMASVPSAIELTGMPLAMDYSVLVDADQVERILINLLRNAYQAMGGSGQINLKAETEGEYVILSIADSGPGISHDHVERVFEPLFTTKAKGIGLGLAVSKRYAQRNGGELSLTRSGPDGSVFSLRLPMGQAAAASKKARNP